MSQSTPPPYPPPIVVRRQRQQTPPPYVPMFITTQRAPRRAATRQPTAKPNDARLYWILVSVLAIPAAVVIGGFVGFASSQFFPMFGGLFAHIASPGSPLRLSLAIPHMILFGTVAGVLMAAALAFMKFMFK